MKRILGIDPSLTSTGLCFGTSAIEWSTASAGSKPSGKTVKARIERYTRLVERINTVLHAEKPTLILVEGYSFGSRNGGEALAEFGGLLRQCLLFYTPDVYEVAPSTLKKFATGKGNSKKEMVMAHIAQRWGQLFATSDLADAFVLYQMGLVAAGAVEAANQHQREAVAKVVA